jgi:hypothetical protein
VYFDEIDNHFDERDLNIVKKKIEVLRDYKNKKNILGYNMIDKVNEKHDLYWK